MFESRPHLLVVDDDDRLRKLLQKYLSEHGFYVTQAADSLEARRLLDWFAFDALIVDVMMPGENGLEFVRWLRRASAVPVLMLSALGEAEQRIEGLERGADDYLPKPFEPKELLLRIERLVKHAVTAQEANRKILFGPFSFNLDTQSLMRDGQPVYLTTVETTLLALLVAHEGKGLSRQTLFERLNAGGNERTVDVQITRLRKKIETNPKQPVFIRTLRGEGYAFFSR